MTDLELTELVKEISRDDFEKAFRHQAMFNSRLRTTGGRYMLQSHHIEINPASYKEFGYAELVGIIKHELCHYHLHIEGKGYRHRDRDFRELLEQTGSPRFCSLVQSKVRTKSVKRYVYECIDCSLEYARKIRMNTARYRCGKCNGKLRLKSE